MTKKFIVQWSHIQRKLSGLPEALADEDAAGTQTWSPNTDVCEGPDEVVIRMELAAVSLDNLEIFIEEQAAVIRGVRQDPACEESAAGYRFRQLEIEYGPFRRVVPLPYAVDADHAKAHMRHGMLEIRLPRAQTTRHTTINVIVES